MQPGVMPGPARSMQFFRHLGAAAIAGGLLGGVSAAVTAHGVPGANPLVAFWCGAALLALLTAPLGLLSLFLCWAGRRLFGARLARCRGEWAELAASPEWRARVLALLIFGLALLTFVPLVTWLASGFVVAIQVPQIRRVLVTLAVGGSMLAGGGACLVAWPLLVRAIGYLQMRGAPVWPRRPAIGVAWLAQAALLAILASLLWRFEDELAFVIRPLGYLVFVVGLGATLLLTSGERRPGTKRLWRLLCLTLGLSALVQPWVLSRVASSSRALARGTFTAPALRLLRGLSDRDRDGFSGVFGGGDCEPRDPRIHPGGSDLLDNGVDENCDGVSATLAAVIDKAPVMSGKVADPKRYNVLWIVVDALRADSLQLYGYRRENTPSLVELGRDARVFLNAYAPSATTHLSFPSLLIGRNADALTWEYSNDRVRLEPAKGQLTLAERLAPAGYRREAIVSSFIAHLPEIVRGFEQVHTEHRKATRHDSPGATAAAIEALKRFDGDREKPFFLLTYYEDPHVPYDEHDARFPRYGSSERDRYDGEIAYVDRYLGQLFDYLATLPETNRNTVVVVTSDHGEEFEEHGGTSHGKSCHEESAHVPLILKVPGLPAARIAERVAGIDIVPTLLELLGIEANAAELDGRSLLAATDEFQVDRPVYCAITNQGSTLPGRPFFERSVRFQQRALLHELVTNQFRLYDTERDRREQHDLSANPAEATTLARLKQLLDRDAGGNLQQQRLGR